MVQPQVPEVAVGAIPPAATVLDVREALEWEAGHVPRAVHLPMSELVARVDEVPAGPVAVMCRVGARSARVTAYLAAHGHEAVNVAGGMVAWVSAGHPVVTDAGDPGTVA